MYFLPVCGITQKKAMKNLVLAFKELLRLVCNAMHAN